MTGFGDRRDRLYDADGGPYCDKAWHLGGEKVPATAVLRCASCARVYARCAQCNRGGSTVQISMRAHLYTCHRSNHALRAKVLPKEPTP